MNCLKCCKTLHRTLISRYHYTECGLDNVYLKNSVTHYTCRCGWEVVEVPSVERLQDAIAYQLLKKRSLFIAEEFRFLRKSVGYTAQKMATALGYKTRITISRWENGKEPITAATDHALRLLVLRLKEQTINQRMFEEVDIQEHFEQIAKKPLPPQKITIDQRMIGQLPFRSSPHLARLVNT